MFTELFARLECAPNFDGNPQNVLRVAHVLTEGKVRYNLAVTPVVIGLHGAYYMVLFRPGEYIVYPLCAPSLQLILHVFAGVDYNAREMYNMHLDNGTMQANSARMSTGRVIFCRVCCGLRVVG